MSRTEDHEAFPSVNRKLERAQYCEGVEVGREALARCFEIVQPHLNERQRRVVAGACSQRLRHGGKSAVAQASGMSRNTVIKAEREVESGIEPSERLRALGGGDRPLIDKQPVSWRLSTVSSTPTPVAIRCLCSAGPPSRLVTSQMP